MDSHGVLEEAARSQFSSQKLITLQLAALSRLTERAEAALGFEAARWVTLVVVVVVAWSPLHGWVWVLPVLGSGLLGLWLVRWPGLQAA